MQTEKRIAAHRKTMDVLEAVLERNRNVRNIAVEEAELGEKMRERSEGEAAKGRMVSARKRQRKKIKKETERSARVEHLLQGSDNKVQEINRKRVLKQDSADRMRELVKEVNLMQTKEEGERRVKVLNRRRERHAAATEELEALRALTEKKCVDQYSTLAAHRQPRMESHPFQGKPARNITRGRVRPASAAISRPTVAASTPAPSPSKPSKPNSVFYSFRVD
eukprot:TRINITY_DN19696_c0_g1_i1.p1 TRINITY_DN19696_c0_g1~~TRINITY_DN19696_c0_g1_i1.p1  ORF type:complete len:222 (+),score=47.71 TRINITY_DN19696_c0_g1_i1:59-724(+)